MRPDAPYGPDMRCCVPLVACAEGEACPAPAQAAPPSLDDRDLAVLRELAREGEALVAFQGLRRRLELHQQALARALKRLARDGLVEREAKGYRLTERGWAAIVPRAAEAAPSPRETLTVAQALLPPGLAQEAAAERLAGRWFRGLRWYGASRAPGETTLTWLTEGEGLAVRLRLSGGALALEAENAPGGPWSSPAAVRAVLAAVAELYGDGAPAA